MELILFVVCEVENVVLYSSSSPRTKTLGDLERLGGHPCLPLVNPFRVRRL